MISATNPASPDSSSTPSVLGVAGDGTVSVYADATCMSTALASGANTAFASPGIAITVPADATTTLYAKNVTADGTSACSAGLAYTNVPPTPPPPPTPGGGGGSGGSGTSGGAGGGSNSSTEQQLAQQQCATDKTRLKRKLQRQKLARHRADTAADRSRIGRNIKKTRRKLRRLAC